MPPCLCALSCFLALHGAHGQPGNETHSHAATSGAQLEPGATSRLLEMARTATAPFENRSAAIAAGYRRIGRDFPSMGEHWLSPRLIVEGVFDVSRPSVLTYVTVEGRPVLTGVVYAIPLAPGEVPPDAFGADASWHEHNGTIDEEGLLAQHHTTPGSATGTRVAVLHAWTTFVNPGGVFAAENWAIPFLRLKLAVPQKFPESAARALSLSSGGKTFFMDVAGSDGDSVVSRALDDCAAAVGLIVSRARKTDHVLTSEEISQLDVAWTRAVDAVASTHPRVARRLNGLAEPGK